MNYLQNIKVWCCNNLVTVGKWGGTSFLFGFVVAAFISGRNIPLHAYVSDGIYNQEIYSSTEFKLDLDPLNKMNEITLPVNNLINSAVNGLRLSPGINIGTNIPVSPIKNPSQNIDIDFNRFFSSSKVSSADIISFLKEAAITGINLSLLIISITSQVLRGLLSVLK